MINFVTKIGRQILSSKAKEMPENGDLLQIVKSTRKILATLRDCHAMGKVVGIYAPVLGEGMFLTGVEDIRTDDDETVVILKRYDLSGNILSRTHFSLHEMQAVCPFDMAYRNPFMEKVAVG